MGDYFMTQQENAASDAEAKRLAQLANAYSLFGNSPEYKFVTSYYEVILVLQLVYLTVLAFQPLISYGFQIPELEPLFNKYFLQKTASDDFQICRPSSLSTFSQFLPENEYDNLSVQNIPQEILECAKNYFSSKE